LKFWFCIDIIATLPLDLIGDFSNSSGNVLNLLKLPRLFRLGKILKFMDNMKGANVIRILRLFIAYFLFAHWFGCFYYLLSDIGAKKIEINDSFLEKYTYALYLGLLIING
jgi:succinate dehydrogenase/fumarate reductase cytochrome b subunit